jgi:soluble lytic murein transglycosylase-like protein
MRRSAILLTLLVVCLSAVPARAELVCLTSGRTMSVKSHRTEGHLVVLQLRTGGEVTFDAALVRSVEADEVPYPEPEPEVASNAIVAEPLAAVPFGAIIDEVAAVHGVDVKLVRALIQVESQYKPTARSRKGAMGLMQLMPSTAKQYAVGNPYDPRANIEAGIRHLKSLLEQFDVSLALAAYNAGEAAVRKFNGIPPYRETQQYVTRILQLVKQS